MSYYAVLSATSALLQQQHLAMRRCRRRFNGPHRYVLFDADGHTINIQERIKSRRMGYTLLEVLEWLAAQPNLDAAKEARILMHDFEDWHQIKNAS